MRWFDESVRDLRLVKAYIEAALLKWGFMLAMLIITAINIIGWTANAKTSREFTDAVNGLTQELRQWRTGK